jgi:hypothetical protein
MCEEVWAAADKVPLFFIFSAMFLQTLTKILHRIAFRALYLLYGYSKCCYTSLLEVKLERKEMELESTLVLEC